MRKLSKLLFLTLATYLPAQAAPASTGDAYAGRVNHVYDASTIRVAYAGGGHIRVKLAAIDAPYAARAKQALAQQTLGKTVRVEELRWQEGYLLGRVSVDGKGVCAALVEQGLARVAAEYAHLPGLRQLENEARLARRGIWAKEPEASS
ncbi:MAG: thermonuclease family protein [Gammaproteobacteria bacterium]|nr:thermonuclease family protein [Gammaproteobacteria bacterium]MDJ0891392.1 thermonuclease family protein [Gammaproteobacteria bacterium]